MSKQNRKRTMVIWSIMILTFGIIVMGSGDGAWAASSFMFQKAGAGTGTVTITDQNSSEAWTCDVNCSKKTFPYYEGHSLQFEAEPAAGSVFGGWQYNGTPVSEITNVVPGDTITAVFQQSTVKVGGINQTEVGEIQIKSSTSTSSSYSCIVGEIRMYAGSTAPSGWLLCDGSAVSRSTYSSLFALIGKSFGAGDGSTTFNLPDFRGRSPLGVGQGDGLSDRTLGESGGEEEHQLTIDEMPEHDHNNTYYMGWSASSIGMPRAGSINPEERVVKPQGGNQPHNTMHPFLSVNFIICSGC